MVAPLVAAVNPTTYGSVRISTGYTTNDDGDRVPTYKIQNRVPMQVQALTERDIFQTDMLNVGGSTHVVFIRGQVDGLVRKDNKGGDLIAFRWPTAASPIRTWLVTSVLEHWPDWTKVSVTLQED